ncbi:hypothetical protein ACFLW1_02190 [Chloroflexota bacterium]
MAIEDSNKPAVALCNEGFAGFARTASEQEGMPGLRIIAETVPCECTDEQQIEAVMNTALDDIVGALTGPLTDDEASPRREVEKTPRIVFRGDLEEVNRFFYKLGLGDGLPVIPPTEVAVAEMLRGTDLPPEYVVGELPPRRGKATVEKIAVNAVMAGALPTYMPLLIAGVQALLDPKLRFKMEIASAHSFAPFWVINGPVRRQLNMDGGSEALSPGDLPNTAFGRAMGLIIKNIAGARKGIEDKGTLGNPAKNSMVVAEWEEESPWSPLHVEQGLEPQESAVSVFYANTCINVPPYGVDDKGILNTIVSNFVPGRRGDSCILLPPVHARTLTEAGWTKADVIRYVTEYARVPAYRHPTYWGLGSGGLAAKEWAPVDAAESMPIIRDTGWLRVVVVGGVSVIIGIFIGAGERSGGEWVTHRVELPANWEKLVERYKDVVPNYISY